MARVGRPDDSVTPLSRPFVRSAAATGRQKRPYRKSNGRSHRGQQQRHEHPHSSNLVLRRNRLVLPPDLRRDLIGVDRLVGVDGGRVRLQRIPAAAGERHPPTRSESRTPPRPGRRARIRPRVARPPRSGRGAGVLSSRCPRLRSHQPARGLEQPVHGGLSPRERGNRVGILRPAPPLGSIPA